MVKKKNASKKSVKRQFKVKSESFMTGLIQSHLTPGFLFADSVGRNSQNRQRISTDSEFRAANFSIDRSPRSVQCYYGARYTRAYFNNVFIQNDMERGWRRAVEN